jgi:hypothetical protein
MSEQAWFNGVALVLVIVVIGGFLAGFGLGGSSSSSPANGPATSTTPAAFNVSLSIATNPNSGLDQYFPANFTVPAGVPVRITITNYDQGINPGVGLPANTSHTFTIPSLGIHVALPAAGGNNTPTVTSFTYTFDPGIYQWNCLAPCDMVSMQTPGYMIGFVTAV